MNARTRARLAALPRGALAVVLILTAGAVCVGCSASAAPPSTAPARVTEITAMLRAHASAVLHHDREAFLAGISPAPRSQDFRSAQGAAFDNLVELPLAAWSYSVSSLADDAAAQRAARAKYGRSAVIAHLQLSYALRGVDTIPTTHELWWTFVRSGDRVLLAADDDLASAGGTSWTGPWDYGPIQLVRGRTCLVVGHPDQAALLPVIARGVDAAVASVSAVWGTTWPREVAVFVPSSAAELDSELGQVAGVAAKVAALARADGTDPVSGRPLGQRLVVEPAVLRTLSPVGRRIVLTHEVTHIADAAATSESTPRWLTEGFADYVGNLGSGQPVPTAAAELRSLVREHRAPTTLPADAAFEGTSTAAPAYEASWLACRLIATEAGTGGLVRFYRAVGASEDEPDQAVAHALRTVLHVSPARFLVQWRSYVSAQLG